jgi:hypothetical protein
MKIFEREISPNDEPSSIDNILSPPTGKSSTAPQPQPEPQPQPPQVNKNTRPASEKSPSGFIASIPFVVMVTIITGAVLAPTKAATVCSTIITGAVLTLTKAAAVFLCLSMLWVAFLIYDAHVKNIGLSKPRQLGLLCHAIPAIFFLLTTKTAESSQDTALVWFMALILFRYWRIMVNIYFWFQYKPAVIIPGLKQVNASDCTVVVPTVGPGEGEKYNKAFYEMITSVLVNHPARLIISTNDEKAEKQVNTALPLILAKIEAGDTNYHREHGLGPTRVTTDRVVSNAEISDKRTQVVDVFKKVFTKITVMADDTAIFGPNFLKATLPAFQSDKVGFVGTRKWVKRQRTYDPAETPGLLKRYIDGFWNTMGGLYLIRHNFEIRATNAADGGVFCVSGRMSLIRTKIVSPTAPDFDNEAQRAAATAFQHAFLNEYILRIGDWFPGWGPVKSDDDNFITRWVINHGWRVKIQYSKAATMTTVLGGTNPLKFPLQALRWSRTTFRQNPIALFADRMCWWEWPLTTWTTLFPWMYNAALVWDFLAVFALTKTHLYAQSAHPGLLLTALVVFIWMSKLVKTIPWFWEYPMDFFLYFVIPAYPLFAYGHSLLKIWTAFTFWDLAWSGRKLPTEPEVPKDSKNPKIELTEVK